MPAKKQLITLDVMSLVMREEEFNSDSKVKEIVANYLASLESRNLEIVKPPVASIQPSLGFAALDNKVEITVRALVRTKPIVVTEEAAGMVTNG